MLSAGPELSRSAGRLLSKKRTQRIPSLPWVLVDGSMSGGAPLYLALREHGRTPGRERGDRWGVSARDALPIVAWVGPGRGWTYVRLPTTYGARLAKPSSSGPSAAISLAARRFCCT